jgi:hypothetical protein
VWAGQETYRTFDSLRKEKHLQPETSGNCLVLPRNPQPFNHEMNVATKPTRDAKYFLPTHLSFFSGELPSEGQASLHEKWGGHS